MDNSMNNQSASVDNQVQEKSLEPVEKPLPYGNHDDNGRQKLIQSAAIFLSNPSIRQQSDLKKRGFLKSKGLTEEEIDAAMLEVMHKDSMQSHSMMSIPPRSPMEPAVFTYARDSFPFYVMLTSMVFGCHYLYKNYLRPFFTGVEVENPTKQTMSMQKDVLDLLKKQQTTVDELVELVKEIRTSTTSLKVAQEGDTNVKLDKLYDTVNDLKTMSLSSKSFNSIPAAPTLPDWQILSKSSKSESGSSNSESQSPQELENDSKEAEVTDKN